MHSTYCALRDRISVVWQSAITNYQIVLHFAHGHPSNPLQIAPDSALQIERLNMTNRFGTFTALDSVSRKVEAEAFHALLREKGAGKSALVKCAWAITDPMRDRFKWTT